MRWWSLRLVPVVAALVSIPDARSLATPGEIIIEDDLVCSYRATLGFAARSAVVDLSSEGELNGALQWVLEVPGRYLLVLGPDGPQAADSRLGQVRTSAVATYLVRSGASSQYVLRGDFDELRSTRIYNGLRPHNVVIMDCELTPVTR
jgi:hypothetical protein